MANEQDNVLAVLRAPLLYHIPGMDAVTARRDIAYRGGAEGKPRMGMGMGMDVYTPHDLRSGERRPAVLPVCQSSLASLS